MKKLINKTEFFFSMTYILVVIIFLFVMNPINKSKKVYKPSQSYSFISSEHTMIESPVFDYNMYKSTTNSEHVKYFLEQPEIEFYRDYKLQSSSNRSNNIDENYQRAIAIAESTPLNIETSKIIIEYCNKLDLQPSLVLALIDLESNFDQYVVGSSNDRGYCQLIPNTEKWLANSYGHILGLEYNPDRIFEPEYNIGLGMLYLHILKQAYGDDYHRILSEYNRGYYNLGKYYTKNNTYVTNYSRGILSRKRKFNLLN